MSTQKFTAQFREAIWEVYNGKCVYCEKGVRFSEFQVDHVIPEATLDSEADGIRSRLGLSDAFNIKGYENLVPSCVTCNKKKRDIALPDGTLAITLGMASSNIDKIKEVLDRRRSERDLDNTLRIIDASIEDSKYTMDDLCAALELRRRFPNGIGGRGSSARNESPELSVSHILFSDNRRVRLTRHAALRMEECGFSFDYINERILASVRDGTAQICEIGGKTKRRLSLHIDPNIKIVCDVMDVGINILTVWHEDVAL